MKHFNVFKLFKTRLNKKYKHLFESIKMFQTLTMTSHQSIEHLKLKTHLSNS